MEEHHSILVATDLSARCDRPLERALLLAQEQRTAVIVLHVHEGKTRMSHDEEQRMRSLIREEFALMPDAVEIVFEYGPVPRTIARVAEERHCSLIVTGVARFNSPRDFLLGTAVDYLVRESPVPVLVVKRRAHHPYKRLLMPIDFSAADTNALLAASELFGDAEFLLVHAYQAAFQAFLEHDSTAGLIRHEAEQAMARLVDQLPGSLRSRVNADVVEGRLYSVLDRLMNDWRADLLVVGSKCPRGGYTHAAVGDDIWELPAATPCDILVVRESSHAVSGLSERLSTAHA